MILQCCKELQYRMYTKDQAICNFGDDGLEFYVIIKGTASVLVPNVIEMEMNILELSQFLKENKDKILWTEENKHILEQFQATQS